jgi:hypothetical protein
MVEPMSASTRQPGRAQMTETLSLSRRHGQCNWPQMSESVARSAGIPWTSRGIWPQIEKQGWGEIPAYTWLCEARALFHGKEGVVGSSPTEGFRNTCKWPVFDVGSSPGSSYLATDCDGGRGRRFESIKGRRTD